MRPSSAETSEPAWVKRKMLSMKSSTSCPSSSRKYSAAVTPVRATRRREPGRLRHLPEDERGLLDDARLLHLVVEVVALAGALPYAGEHRDAAVLLGDVVDELLDEHGLAHAGAAEEAGLAAPGVGLEQIHHLDAGLEHLDLGGLLVEGGRGAVDRVGLAVLLIGPILSTGSPMMLMMRPSVSLPTGIEIGGPVSCDRHAAHEAVGRGHGDRAHLALAEVLGDLEHELRGVREDVGAPRPRRPRGRCRSAGSLPGSNSTSTTGPITWTILPGFMCSCSLRLASTDWRSASAPPTMSRSSLVMRSWRALLYWIVRTLIISLAFLVAASIAVIRAPYSPATDSIRARYTWVVTWRGSSEARIASGLGS